MDKEREAILKDTIGYSEIAHQCATCFWFKEDGCECIHSPQGEFAVLKEACCDFWVYKHTKPRSMLSALKLNQREVP